MKQRVVSWVLLVAGIYSDKTIRENQGNYMYKRSFSKTRSFRSKPGLLYTHLSQETMKRASVDLEGVFQKKAQRKTDRGGASARSRKPPVDSSLPWANRF